MRTFVRRIARCVLVAAVLPGGAHAQTFERGIACPATGNSYFRTRERLTFLQAEAWASDLGGTLVTVETEEEQAWLRETFGRETTWIGLSHPHETWANGAAVAWTNWREGEPGGGEREPCVVMNWRGDEWIDVSGDPFDCFFEAIVEVPGVGAAERVEPRPAPEPSTLPAGRAALVVLVEGLEAKDLESRKLPHLSALATQSSVWPDAGGDFLEDVRAAWGLVTWGVGYWKSGMTTGRPGAGDSYRNEHFLSRIEAARPEVFTASALTQPSLHGVVLGGNARTDARVSGEELWAEGSDVLLRLLAEPAPLCVTVGIQGDEGEGPLRKSARSQWLQEADRRLGQLLEAMRGRPTFEAEDWLVVVVGPGEVGTSRPLPREEGFDEVEEVVQRPLLVSGDGWSAGRRRDEATLADVFPTVVAHFEVQPTQDWRLDGRRLPGRAPTRLGQNLIVNGDAESSLGWHDTWDVSRIPGWRVQAYVNVVDVHRLDVSPAGAPGGSSCFAGGYRTSLMEQRVDLGPVAEEVRSGKLRYSLRARLGHDRSSGDSMVFGVTFFNDRGRPVEEATIGPVTTSDRRELLGFERGVVRPGLLPVSREGRVPRTACSAIVRLSSGAARVGATNALADDLELIVHLD